MIRILNERIYEGGIKYIEGACVHDDTKPTTGIVTGSTLIEADTGDVYMFYEDSTTPAWTKIGAAPAQAGT